MKKQVTWVGLLLCLLLFVACEKPVLENNDGGSKANNVKNKLTRVVRIRPKELRVETVEEAMEAKLQPSVELFVMKRNKSFMPSMSTRRNLMIQVILCMLMVCLPVFRRLQ